MYITNVIDYIAKKRELRDAAPERCCLTLSDIHVNVLINCVYCLIQTVYRPINTILSNLRLQLNAVNKSPHVLKRICNFAFIARSLQIETLYNFVWLILRSIRCNLKCGHTKSVKATPEYDMDTSLLYPCARTNYEY